MKRILINATHAEEIRVARCKDNHLYDFDLENRTREQKKSNIYKGHVTRVEPSLEAVFVEYGSQRQGFLPIREIASEYLNGNPRDENIKKLIKEGDELIVQVEKEERGNKGAALSTYVSLAGRYLVLMPNNPKGGGISRQISGKMRDDMKQMLRNLDMPKSMSVIIRTSGIGKTQEDMQHDLNHLLNIWQAIGEQNKNYPSPRLVHQEAGVVTRAVRDYLRDDISEIWIDNEDAFAEAETFVRAVMPKQIDKLRKYTDYEPMFSRFGIEKQIETAYQREVRLPSGGSIVIDQTEALVSIDINSARSTKGADVSETAYHTNLEAADEIARQLRLRDMGGLIVIDFIDMSGSKHQKDVEKRLVDATRYDRARVQFGEISRFGLMEMSRQRLRPSLEESTGYICPRCNGNGMIRDLRSLSLSIMRQIEQIALRERHGELQAEVPTDIAAFLLNEKRESLVYLEQDSGTRITILPHAHLESPNFNLHFNHHGFAPSSYERVTDTQLQETVDRGYEVNWQTSETERPEQQPTRPPRTNPEAGVNGNQNSQHGATPKQSSKQTSHNQKQSNQRKERDSDTQRSSANQSATQVASNPAQTQAKPEAVAWLSNLFAPTPQAQTAQTVSSADAAEAIEAIVNAGGQSRGMFGQLASTPATTSNAQTSEQSDDSQDESRDDERHHKDRKGKGRNRKNDRRSRKSDRSDSKSERKSDKSSSKSDDRSQQDARKDQKNDLPKREPNSRRDSRGAVERGEARPFDKESSKDSGQASNQTSKDKQTAKTKSEHKSSNPDEVNLRVNQAPSPLKEQDVVHLSLDDSKPVKQKPSERTEQAERASDTVTKESSTSSQTKTTHDAVAQNSDDVATSNERISGKSLDFTEQDVFAERYVTAQKYGQASNDPRVVRAKHQVEQSKGQEGQSSEQPASKTKEPTLIVGTVGEFIVSVFDDGASRIENDGVIASFLQALATVGQTSQEATANDVQTNTASSADDVEQFSFVNYGYEPLSASELTQFAVMTAPVAMTQAEQGKTEVMPRPIGKRASNDPRGQHPDFVDNDVDNKANQADKNEVNVDATTSANPSVESSEGQANSANPLSPLEVMQELLSLTTGQLVERVLGDVGKDLIASGKTEMAFLQTLNQPFDVLMSVAEQAEAIVTDAPSQDKDVKDADTKGASDIEPKSVQAQIADDEQAPASALTSPHHSE